VEKTIGQRGQHAVSVVCDLSDFASVRRAAAEIVALNLPIVGLLNNAGIFPMRATKNALGWDMAFRNEPSRTVRLDRGALTASPQWRECRLRLFRRRRSRTQARQGRWFSRRSLHLSRGERPRRVETRRLRDAGRGRLRHLEAVQPRYGNGVCP
jgi:hypothetical protein